MTLSMSTSSRDLPGLLFGECGSGAVPGWVVGDAVEPAAVDDAYPGAREDPGGVGVVLAGGAGVVVDLRGPGAGVAAVIGVDGDGSPESLVAGPAEVHGAVLAGLAGDGGDAGEGGDGVGVLVGWLVQWMDPEGPHSVENIDQHRYHAIRIEL